MFVIVEDRQFIHLGPMAWNQRMFQSYIRDDLGLNFSVPLTNDTKTPIVINEHFEILPAVLVYPAVHNSKIEQYAGPSWVFTDVLATGTFTNAPKEVEVVKNELKNIVAHNRWEHEIGGITVTVQGGSFPISTDRATRDIYAQAIQLKHFDQQWKFGNMWLVLSEVDLTQIVTDIVTHIQDSFNWEQQKSVEIDTATTLQQLDTIQLTFGA